MKVRDVMSAPAITVDATTPFADVVDVMLTNEVSGLPVVGSDGELLGIVTEADLVSKEAYGFRRRRALGLIKDFLTDRDPQWVRKGAGRTARDVMTAAPLTASPEDDLPKVARAMLERHHKRLPVVSDGRVVGIVSRHDVLAPFHRSDAELQRDLVEMLADPGRIPESHQVSASVADGVVTLSGSVLFPSDIALVEAMAARIPGVVGLDNHLTPREPEPTLSVPL